MACPSNPFGLDAAWIYETHEHSRLQAPLDVFAQLAPAALAQFSLDYCNPLSNAASAPRVQMVWAAMGSGTGDEATTEPS